MDDAADGDDTITYQFDMPTDEWREWTNTIPRNTPIDVRLQDLIRQDASAVAQAQNGDTEAASIELLASRIRIRATQALGAVRGEDVDRETAVEQLEEVTDLASALED